MDQLNVELIVRLTARFPAAAFAAALILFGWVQGVPSGGRWMTYGEKLPAVFHDDFGRVKP